MTPRRRIHLQIFEWCGRWITPDRNHGGVNPGPFRLLSDAEETLARYIHAECSYTYCDGTASESDPNEMADRFYIDDVSLPILESEDD